MGLDITAYSRLESVGRHADDWCSEDDHIRAFAYDSFPASFRGLTVLGSISGYSGSKFLDGGCYVATDATKTHGFRAGSYGGYNHWRSDMAVQFNPYGPSTPPDPAERFAPPGGYPTAPNMDGPFAELIWFADNEGCIGPDAARDLLADFELYADLYHPQGDWPNQYREKYADWTLACRLAADGGLIHFH